MTYNDQWLAMLEELYGKEYVEKLLRDIEQDNERVDANRQNENSE